MKKPLVVSRALKRDPIMSPGGSSSVSCITFQDDLGNLSGLYILGCFKFWTVKMIQGLLLPPGCTRKPGAGRQG